MVSDADEDDLDPDADAPGAPLVPAAIQAVQRAELHALLHVLDSGDISPARLASLGFVRTDDHGPQYVREVTEQRYLVVQGDNQNPPEFSIHDIDLGILQTADLEEMVAGYYASLDALRAECQTNGVSAEQVIAEIVAERRAGLS